MRHLNTDLLKKLTWEKWPNQRYPRKEEEGEEEKWVMSGEAINILENE